MGVRGVSALPVLDGPSGRVLGLLSRHNVLAAYERSVAGSVAEEASTADGHGHTAV
jgi:hypothetical protein